MTVIATLERGGTTVELPLLDEAANILVAVDVAKPNLITHQNGGTPYPRIQDQWSGQETYNLLGKFIGSTAYQDAIDLANILTQDGDGSAITMNIPDLPEIEEDIKVVPSAGQGNAATLNYQPGRKNVVDFDVGLTRVSSVSGAYNRTITTPTATGTGPIEIQGPINTVELYTDIEIERTVGRPNDVIRRNQGAYPNYYPKPKVVNDEWDISLLFTDDATGKTEQIAQIFRSRVGRDGITLDFNGIYGLGAIDVMPRGSSGLRHIRDAGKEGVTIIPQINVSRIQTP